jgi:hypothetical protein
LADRLSAERAARLAIGEFLVRYGGDREGLRAGPPARVVRLDRPGAYVLVPVRDTAGLRGIVQLDNASGNVESSAAIRDPSSPFLLDEGTALAAARGARPDRRGWKSPFLGWRACRECPSSLLPLWVVPHSGGEVFVTQSGEVLDAITEGRGG